MNTKQLISPHAIEMKCISTKNEEIKAKVKHFDFSGQSLFPMEEGHKKMML